MGQNIYLLGSFIPTVWEQLQSDVLELHSYLSITRIISACSSTVSQFNIFMQKAKDWGSL